MKSTGHIFKGNTTQVLRNVWETIKKEGTEYKGQRGKIKSLKATTMIIDDPLNEEKNYPYWSKDEDDWYQDNFVRKETSTPPEDITSKKYIYCYKYVWRSRYYDSGWGYLLGTLRSLRQIGIENLEISTVDETKELLSAIYKIYHPEIVLNVLSWKGKELINFYLKNMELVSKELNRNRQDSLINVIEELKKNPNSRRAITASFTYENIDHSGVAGAVPVYQNYQLYSEFDAKGIPCGLISMHLHRAMDAYGGTQLDINHDKYWGMLASKILGLPLKQMIIYCNDIYYHVKDPKAGQKNLTSKTNIQDWLLTITDAYEISKEDIVSKVNCARYENKVYYMLKKFND